VAYKHALLHGLVTGTRGRRSNGWSASAALGLTLLLTRSVQAQALGPTLLSYHAPDDCPEVAEFQKSVQRRSARVRFVDEGSHERELSIALSKEGDFTIGELRLIERDGSLRQRSVRFTSCAEAVEGLALITVVSLDPQALLQAPPPEPAPEKKPTLPPTPPKAPAKPAKPVEPVPPPVKPPPSPSHPSHLEAALGGEFVAGFQQLPHTALGGALLVDVASGSPSWFAPLLRLAVSHSERRGISTGDTEANFALTQGTLSACPVKVGDESISLRPCAFTTAGVLRAWSSDSIGVHTRTRPSWAWGGSLLVFLHVTQTTEIIANFSAASPLIRDRFEAQPAWSWMTPPLYLSSGVGLRFVFR
jgi:hypothetical protein